MQQGFVVREAGAGGRIAKAVLGIGVRASIWDTEHGSHFAETRQELLFEKSDFDLLEKWEKRRRVIICMCIPLAAPAFAPPCPPEQ